MERLVDLIIPIGAGPEIAVVSTKALTSQLATLYLLSKASEGKYLQARRISKNYRINLVNGWGMNYLKTLIKLIKKN